MDGAACQAAVQGVIKVGHDLVSNQQRIET